ncbi:hypothetical protein SNOG_03840 [Parastagonospora nodorum SN15]|uniref:Uncharacterized protein n=1 Tax=Phaeosphaeria nodorum (strain SN15 / ATCC MYA-4574 / FGSC 10173) TaxID=321614 RepID=Q0UWM4_PHANO|nr:hypothetical protein SNOG_03840 [Parastagonospora nodorum SN15]EAT89045.1 hypothetical protein SNOG_03840 [Parastagonospora nodorum SN15]
MRLGTPEFLASPQFLVTGADDRGVTSEKTGLGRGCRRSDMSEAIRILHAMRRQVLTPCDAFGMLRHTKWGRETPVGTPCGVQAPWDARRGITESWRRQMRPSHRVGSQALLCRQEATASRYSQAHAMSPLVGPIHSPHFSREVAPSESSALDSERIEQQRNS